LQGILRNFEHIKIPEAQKTADLPNKRMIMLRNATEDNKYQMDKRQRVENMQQNASEWHKYLLFARKFRKICRYILGMKFAVVDE